MTPLEAETKAAAIAEEGHRETDGPNDSPKIRRWLAFVNIDRPASYCAAFVCCTVRDAGLRVPVLPSLKRTASAQRLLDLNPHLVIDRAEAVQRMRDGRPVIFVQRHAGGKGHCGFGIGVVDDERFESTEGNTGPGPAAPAKDRDGQGNYRRRDRRLGDVDGWLMVG